jgi:hypothetical protein
MMRELPAVASARDVRKCFDVSNTRIVPGGRIAEARVGRSSRQQGDWRSRGKCAKQSHRETRWVLLVATKRLALHEKKRENKATDDSR